MSGTIDEGVFRTVLGHFASGVVVVTGLHAGGPVGLTCQSFFSVSINPPLVAVCPSTRSTSWPRLQERGRFAVNVLAERQEHLARAFSIAGADKFAGVGWSSGPEGMPHIDGCLAWVDCTVEEVHPAGDHLLVVGLVTDLSTGGGEPLIFYRGGYGGFRP